MGVGVGATLELPPHPASTTSVIQKPKTRTECRRFEFATRESIRHPLLSPLLAFALHFEVDSSSSSLTGHWPPVFLGDVTTMLRDGNFALRGELYSARHLLSPPLTVHFQMFPHKNRRLRILVVPRASLISIPLVQPR